MQDQPFTVVLNDGSEIAVAADQTILDAIEAHAAAQVAHALGLELEHADRVAAPEQFERLGVLHRNLVDINVDPVPALDQGGRLGHDGERLEPQEVGLQQAERLDVVLLAWLAE